MKRLIALLAALLIGAPAFGQSVSYNPPITARHLPYWVTAGVLADGGTAADSPISTIGATGPICSNSARQSTGAWTSLCLQANTNSAGVISIQNFGGANPQGLNFNINGAVVTLPTSGGNFIFGNPPFVTGDVPTFFSSAGVLVDSGVGISGGSINSGAWQGTPVAIGFGGTGATSQAQAQTNLGLGSMATQNSNSVAITGGAVTGMPTPVNASDVAIKSYVDATSSGLTILAPSTLATTTVLPNTPTYANGTAGVGATLTSGSNTTLTVDSTAAPLATVVLVKNQAAPAQNGIYTVTTAGSGSAAWVLTRATYFDIASQMKAGSYTFITSGVVNLNSAYTLAAAVNTVGTDPLNFNLFNSTAGGTVSSVATGSGLTGGPITSTGTISLAPIASNTLLMNTTGGSAAPISTTPTLMLDTFGATQGDILYRGSSAWTVLAPGTSGQFLQTQGSGSVPQWATAGAGAAGQIAWYAATGNTSVGNTNLFYDSVHSMFAMGSTVPYTDNNNAVGAVFRNDNSGPTRLGVINQSTNAAAESQLNLNLGAPTGANFTMQLNTVAGQVLAGIVTDSVPSQFYFGGPNFTFQNAALTQEYMAINATRTLVEGNLYVGGSAPNAETGWFHTATNFNFSIDNGASSVQLGGVNDNLGSYVSTMLDGAPLALNSQSGGDVCIAETTCNVPLEVNGNARAKGHLLAAGSAPTISACGTGSPAIGNGSGDNFGSVTAGTVATSCVINFAVAWTVAPACTVSSPTAIASLTVDASITQLTIGGTALGGDKIRWVCGSSS